MPVHTEKLLSDLDQAKLVFNSRSSQRILKLLGRLSRITFRKAEALLRYHEILLFLRAYPHSPAVLAKSEAELNSFRKRIDLLISRESDISVLEVPENSGIAGIPVIDTFSYFIVRWLQGKYPRQTSFYWDWFEDENRLAQTWPRFMPLLFEDTSVEAHVPYREWLRRARGKRSEVQWLVNRFESLKCTDDERAELYDSQQLYLLWTPANSSSRTGMRLHTSKIFFHHTPLIRRRDIDFRKELSGGPPPMKRIDERLGQRILEMARETSTLRYRELYGFTHGTKERVIQAELGRGVDLFVFDLPAGRRLPWRAYHAAIIFKNGVPIGYFEGLSLFERMESGFNLYYTFREGETAWLYARILNAFHHLLGVNTFTLDPYQIGHENEEGIESGAFWFYRKLGFRSTQKDLVALTATEEKKISSRKSYRTPARILRQLAVAPMVFELAETDRGDWDEFQIRNVGFAVQRQIAKTSQDGSQLREQSSLAVSKQLGINIGHWATEAKRCFSDFAVVLRLMKSIDQWSAGEKELLLRIIRSKHRSPESRYLKLMQEHKRLRKEFLKLGSKSH